MAIGPAAFLSGVSGLIRIGRALKDAWEDRLLADDYTLLLPPRFPPNRHELESRACGRIGSLHPNLLDEGGRFHGLFAVVGGREVPNRERADLIDKAIDWYLSEEDFGGPPTPPEDLAALELSPAVVVSVRDWLQPGQLSRRARLGREVAKVALEIITVQPDILGLNRRATGIVGGVAANLNALVLDDDTGGADDRRPGERLVSLFVRASLQTVAERPEIFVSDERWAPLVQGIVVPLKEELESPGGLAFENAGHERLRRLIRGPIAHSVLTAINANADAFLTGRFAGDDVLGAVARSVLGVVTSPRQGEFDLREVFTEEGAGLIFSSALKVAQDRPELFVGGKGELKDAQRELLGRLAGVLDTAERPYKLRGGLAPQIAAATFEVAGAYASARLRADPGSSPWASAGVDVADLVIKNLVDGFTEVVDIERRRANTSRDAANPFERIFSREQAVDILKIIATQVAVTPAMVVGDRANPEVKNIAKGVAQLLHAQGAELLDGADWRLVVTTAMDIASRNPGALFGLDADESPKDQIAVALVGTLLSSASANVAARQPGAILFGRTLREAVTATLLAASSNLLLTPIPADGGAAPDSRLASRVDALKTFVTMLLAHASGPDARLRMSADEWLYVYRYFVAHVIANGPDVFAEPGEGMESPLVILNADRIIEVLEGRRAGSAEEGDVG
jgi:hypothetical protein